MNICFIAWERFGVGGVSRVLTRIINALSEEHSISVYCLKRPPLINTYGLNLDKIRFFHHEMNTYEKVRRSLLDKMVSKTPLFSSSIGARIYALLKYTHSFKKRLSDHINRYQYDVVIFGSGFESSLLLSLVKPHLHARVKIISWSHSAYDDYFGVKGKFFSTYFHHAIDIFYRRFDQIIVLSDSDKQKFESFQRLPARRIYNPSSFTAKRYSELSSKTFLFAGSLSAHKGADLALKAFQEFSRRNEEWTLHIYGEGPLRPWMENFIRIHGLQSRAYLHGNHEHMEYIFPQHNIFLFPSRYEGFGLVQVEAMSCGLPIIAADIPICRELVLNSGTGLLFQAGDTDALCAAMHRLANEDLTPYASRGYEREKLFTIQQIAREWNNMLQELYS